MKLKQLNTLYKYKNFPLKIFDFKRSKWLRLKKSNRRFKLRVYDFSKIALSLSRNRRWNKLSQIYKRKLLTRRLIRYYLSKNGVSFSFVKKFRKDLLTENIYKYLFTLNNLLRYSYQTHNENYSKAKLFKKVVFFNDCTSSTTQSFILSKGDLINIKKFQENIQENFLKYNKKGKLYPFFQYDPYAQNLILVKDVTELSKYDIALSILEFIELEKLI
jgi:hypothetical protein